MRGPVTPGRADFASLHRVLDFIVATRLMMYGSDRTRGPSSRRNYGPAVSTSLLMKRIILCLSFASALAATLLVAGCTNGQSQKENLLATAGFRNILATTPQQKTLLAGLPANQISTVQKDGKIWFVYPKHTAGSAMVGTQA